MLVKICGMRDPENIAELDSLNPDFIGFIFYPMSKRYVSGELPASHAKRIGVFVNETIENVLSHVVRYKLDGVQLHGFESPSFCRRIKESGIIVFKAFQIAKASDFRECKEYALYCDYFLFDTKNKNYGGSGQKFDWSLLDAYDGPSPFFLSGGISDTDVEQICQLSHPFFAGVDLNSGFELAPAVKDIGRIRSMLMQIK